MSLYVVIPAYNEEQNIEQCVNDWYTRISDNPDDEWKYKLWIKNPDLSEQ